MKVRKGAYRRNQILPAPMDAHELHVLPGNLQAAAEIGHGGDARDEFCADARISKGADQTPGSAVEAHVAGQGYGDSAVFRCF